VTKEWTFTFDALFLNITLLHHLVGLMNGPYIVMNRGVLVVFHQVANENFKVGKQWETIVLGILVHFTKL
jgi:hypothetical protein